MDILDELLFIFGGEKVHRRTGKFTNRVFILPEVIIMLLRKHGSNELATQLLNRKKPFLVIIDNNERIISIS